MRTILSIIIGTIFLISGWLKGVDPFGTSLKIDEYFNLFGFDISTNIELVLSIMLSSFEMGLALLLLFGLYRRAVATTVVTLLLTFTTLTAYTAFAPYVTIIECGCFGEAVKLTNSQTFFKNITLLGLSILHVILTFKSSFIYNYKDHRLALYLLLLAVMTPLYSAIYLPPFDFLPYNIGDDIIDNKEFKIFDKEFNDVTKDLIPTNSSVLIFTTHDSFNTQEISIIQSVMKSQPRSNYILLSSNIEHDTISNTSLYYASDLMLKTIIRSYDNGIILVDKGVIKGKWRASKIISNRLTPQIYLAAIYWSTLIFALLVAVYIYYMKNHQR